MRYLHSDIETLERVEILRDLRRGDVRRAGRHQPAARGARPAGGVAGGHPRRRQGGLPAVGRLAHPDRRAARRATSAGASSCTPTSMTDSMRRAIAETDRRRRRPGGLQRRARHHAGVDREGDRRRAVERLRARLRRGAGAAERRRRAFRTAGGARRAHRRARARDAGGGGQPRLRAGGDAPRPDQAR